MRDWTNAELAELYRVEHSLRQAGIAAETDRGCADEGDPWFVFCHPDGQVVVHIARIDGLYHLYCATLPEPLIGPSFSAIAKAFVGAIPAPVQNDAGSKVVRHPSALLSLLVAAAMFSFDALLRHSASAAEVPVSPHSQPPLANLPPSKKSELTKQIGQTFAAAVWRSPESNSSEAAWRAVESAALAFSVLSTALMTPETQETGHTIETVGVALVSVPARLSSRSFESAPEIAASASAPMSSGSAIAAGAFENGPSFFPALALGALRWSGETFQAIGPSSLTGGGDTASAPAVLGAWVGVGGVAAAGGITPLLKHEGAHDTIVILSALGETISLGEGATSSNVVISGNGALTVRHAQDAASIKIASGTHATLTLLYDQSPSGDPVSQTLTLNGATHVSSSVGSSSDAASPQPLHLTLDSQGSQANELSIDTPATHSAPSVSITVTGEQNMVLNKSAAFFAGSNLNAAALSGSLTLGLDFSQSASNLIVGSGNFSATPQDNIALENLPNHAEIDLGIDLDLVILGHGQNAATASAPFGLSVGLGGVGGVGAPVAISQIDASGVTNLLVSSGGGGANTVHEISDTALTSLELTGQSPLWIGSLTGIAAGNGQSVLIDASKLAGSFIIDASGVADSAAGGRQVSIITGTGDSIVSDFSTAEAVSFTLGTGHTVVNIAGATTVMAISGLKATDQVNVGSSAFTDTFINGLTHLQPNQSAIDASDSLSAAAAAAANLLETGGEHQAVLFSYKGDAYVFVDPVGNHTPEAIVKIVGVSPSSDLSGVFHSA